MIPLKDENPTELTPFVTAALIALNVLVWLVVQGAGTSAQFLDSLCLYGAIPAKIAGRVGADASIVLGQYVCPIGDGSGRFSLLTSMFLHGSWMHLIGNMWFLWVFGNNIEDSMGHARFVVFYLGTGLAATGVHVLIDLGSVIPVVGASGAISGVMGAYMVLYPRVRVHTFVFLVFIVRVIPLPAAAWLGLWFGIQLLSAFGGAEAGVAFWAHVGGFAAGAGAIKLFERPKLVEAKRQHRKLRPDEIGRWDRW